MSPTDVTEGLILQYDGIDNAGYGAHDPAATSWLDLTGNGQDATLGGDYTVLADGVTFNTNNNTGVATFTLKADASATGRSIEICALPVAIVQNARLCGENALPGLYLPAPGTVLFVR